MSLVELQSDVFQSLKLFFFYRFGFSIFDEFLGNKPATQPSVVIDSYGNSQTVLETDETDETDESDPV